MTTIDGRRRWDPKSDRGITWALVLGLVALLAVAGYFYGGEYLLRSDTASASSAR